MKYFKKLQVYKASNVIFDPNNIVAYSYKWWKFVSVIDGKVIFNDYTYSMSTARHQNLVKGLMDDLGIKIDLFIETNLSLSEDKQAIKESVIKHLKYKQDQLKQKIDSPRSHKATNENRIKEMIQLQRKINIVSALLK